MDSDLLEALRSIVGGDHVVTGGEISEDYSHDECVTTASAMPDAVVMPIDTTQVAAIASACNDHNTPLTARGAGTGLSGACTPRAGGVLISFERMSSILEIDPDNHVAVVQPGVTLSQLDEALAPHKLTAADRLTMELQLAGCPRR